MRHDPALEQASIVSLLNGLSGQLEVVDRYERLLDQTLARRFNPLKYIDRDENAVTEILRDLLDPNGAHGQEAAFLHEFLLLLGTPEPIDRLRRAKVRTQTKTQKGRLLDLTIDVPQGVYVGIENKIDAAEQDNQIPDYVDFVKGERENSWRLVFLTPSGRKPENMSPARKKELMDAPSLACYSYHEDIAGWLRQCAAVCSADRVRLFLRDMAQWAQNMNTGGQMDLGKATLIAGLVSKDQAHLDAALSIMDNVSSVQAVLLAPFVEDVWHRLEAKYPEGEYKLGCELADRDLIASLREGGNGRYKGIYVSRMSWPRGCCVGVQAEGTKVASDCIYGVFWPKWRDTDAKRGELLSAKLNGLLGKSRAPEDKWPWWRPLPALGLIDAQNLGDSQTIRAIYSQSRGELEDHFVGLFERLVDIASTVLTENNETPLPAAAR